MKNTFSIFILLVIILLVNACSTKKDSFSNRKYHSITARYNILYNGQLAFDKGLKRINEEHEDNFWKRLPVEAITFKQQETTENTITNTDTEKDNTIKSSGNPFERAEEKATKAIQKHSMTFNGYEKNPEIDDAYLLLGKSRYYTQRYIPAIEAYNYILANYPNANLNYEARIWRAKANTRLGNERIAIQALNLLVKVLDEKEKIPLEIQEQGYTAMAMAYSKTDSIGKVVEYLKKATRTFINRDQSARNMFILGQIYSELGHKDSARVIFKKLANTRKAPDKYRVHANIEYVKNTVKDSSDTDLMKKFKKLIRNIDNKKYLDELYYQNGVLHENNGNIKEAIANYKKSLQTNNGSAYQKTYTYERLGTLYFNQSDYLTAGAYYDSVLKVVPKEHIKEKRIRRIKRKTKGLLLLSKYEKIATTNDSILHLVSLNKEERINFFNNYIERLEKQEKEKEQRQANARFGKNTDFIKNSSYNRWYFYNPSLKQLGEKTFKRVWGNRALEDNWRWSDNRVINTNTTTVNIGNIDGDTTKKYAIENYLKAIPNKKGEIDNLKQERNNALYNIGLIYKEKFKDTSVAIEKLERLKQINESEELILPTHYHLYQLYKETKQDTKASKTKDFILNKYPNSKFASIIQNTNKKPQTDKELNEISKNYKNIYLYYKKGRYQEAIQLIDNYSQIVNKSELIPKLALLRALCVGKVESKEAYKKALQFVIFNYPNTEQSLKAKEITKLLK